MNIKINTVVGARPNFMKVAPVIQAIVSTMKREVGFWMSGETVGPTLDRVVNSGVGPRSITVDYGTEFQSRVLENLACRRGRQFDFIRPGKPVENAFTESFNGRQRDECLNVHQLTSLAEAQYLLKSVGWIIITAVRTNSELEVMLKSVEF